MLTGGTALLAQNDQLRIALDNLVAVYPDALAGHDGAAMPAVAIAVIAVVWAAIAVRRIRRLEA